MADVFSRQVELGGAFSSDGARITFGTNFGLGMLVQNVNFNYQQNINRLYEVGSNQVYLVAGRTQGQCGIQRICGPAKLATAFYTQFGNACNAGDNNLRFTFTTGCNTSSTGREGVFLQHAVMTQIGINVTSQDMLINEQLQIQFLTMRLV